MRFEWHCLNHVVSINQKSKQNVIREIPGTEPEKLAFLCLFRQLTKYVAEGDQNLCRKITEKNKYKGYSIACFDCNSNLFSQQMITVYLLKYGVEQKKKNPVTLFVF